MTQRAVFVSLFLIYWPAYGQENKEDMNILLGPVGPVGEVVAEVDINESARFHSGARWALANVDLPAHVIAPMGQVTLFADYANAGEKGVPLYLVNRTWKPLILNFRYGDVYLKLEFLGDDGKWQRAQGHCSSGCGSSFGASLLNPGQYKKMEGYHPATGTPAKIRYACYGSEELISNAGQGFYRPEDAVFSKSDGLAYSLTPSALIQRLSVGEVDPRFISWTDRIAALRLAQILGVRASLKAEAEKWRQELAAKDSLTPDESQALAALPPLLASAWQDEADPGKLLRHCLKLIVSPPKANAVFGSPETIPGLLWEAVADLKLGPMVAYPKQEEIPEEAWQPVLKLASQRLLTMDERSQQAAMMLLGNERLADEFLSDAVWEPLLQSGHEQIVEMAATSLSRRTRWERLVELGSKLSTEDQVTVLYALAKGQSSKKSLGMTMDGSLRSPEESSPEDKFWRHCMKTSPAQVAVVWCRLALEMDTVPPYEDVLNQHLLDYWSAKISTWELMEKDFELKSEGGELDDTLDYVIQRSRPDDSPNFHSGADVKASLSQWITLLRGLLTNRGYEGGNQVAGIDPFGTKNQKSREYVLRKKAVRALKRLGEPMPENIILEVNTEVPESPAVEAPKPE